MALDTLEGPQIQMALDALEGPQIQMALDALRDLRFRWPMAEPETLPQKPTLSLVPSASKLSGARAGGSG